MAAPALRAQEVNLSIDQVLVLLARTPDRLGALTAHLTPAQLQRRPHRDEWSLNEVLAHMRACADVWGACMTTMVVEDMPTLRAVNPRTWIKSTDYPRLEFQTSFRSYKRQRARLLAMLQPLPPEGWARTAKVTGAGALLERSVLTYGRWMASHERAHVKQVTRMIEAMQR